MKPAHTPQLRDTQEAFDSVAVDYDGPRGNNVGSGRSQWVLMSCGASTARALGQSENTVRPQCGTRRHEQPHYLDALLLVHASFIEPSNRISRSNTIADFAYSRRRRI
jgi:hypothetical protein